MDNFVPALVAITVSIPLFRGLSFLAEAAAVHFGGKRLVAAIVVAGFAALLGAYPITILVDGIRGAIDAGWTSEAFLHSIGFFLGSGLLTYWFGRFLLNAVSSKRDGFSEAGE